MEIQSRQTNKRQCCPSLMLGRAQCNLILLWLCPFQQLHIWSQDVHKMASEYLLHDKLSALPGNEDVLTKVQQVVRVGYLIVGQLIKECTHIPTQEVGYHQHHSRIQANDTVCGDWEHMHTLQYTQHVSNVSLHRTVNDTKANTRPVLIKHVTTIYCM